MPNVTSPPEARLFEHAAVVECADRATLDELLATVLATYVVRRLSETVVVVDHAHLDALIAALGKGGYTPKISAEVGA